MGHAHKLPAILAALCLAFGLAGALFGSVYAGGAPAAAATARP